MNANVAQGNRGLADEDSKLKTKINDAVQTIMCAAHTKKASRRKREGERVLWTGKTEPILISAHGYECGGGVVLRRLIGLRSRELKPAMSFQSII